MALRSVFAQGGALRVETELRLVQASTRWQPGPAAESSLRCVRDTDAQRVEPAPCQTSWRTKVPALCLRWRVVVAAGRLASPDSATASAELRDHSVAGADGDVVYPRATAEGSLLSGGCEHIAKAGRLEKVQLESGCDGLHAT